MIHLLGSFEDAILTTNSANPDSTVETPEAAVEGAVETMKEEVEEAASTVKEVVGEGVEEVAKVIPSSLGVVERCESFRASRGGNLKADHLRIIMFFFEKLFSFRLWLVMLLRVLIWSMACNVGPFSASWMDHYAGVSKASLAMLSNAV